MTNQNFDDIIMDEAPAASSFIYVGRLEIEEWVYLSLEKRTRNGGYVKPDVPYYHVATQPLSYRISDGGQEGDGLEHTYVAIKTAQGELTPKNSAREELVNAFGKVGFKRNTHADLKNNPAIGKVFKFKRYNRQYSRKGENGETTSINGELMNTPFELLPDNWQPEPGMEIPAYTRKLRQRDGASAPMGGVSSGGVATPKSVTPADLATRLVGIDATEKAARDFVMENSDLAVGDILDMAIGSKVLASLTEQGLIDVTSGKVALV